MNGNGCVSECLSLKCHSCAQILERGERCLGRDIEYPRKRQHPAPRVRVTLLNTTTKVLCQYCPRQEGLNRGGVLRSRCQLSWSSPPPHWAGRGPVNESIMFGEWSILHFFFFCFCFSFCFLRSVHAFI